ncbi:hypothetical protein BGZ58_011088 [Dissophora ornata]|nr:hypothetical protein BGZ58_011088 [Dissophora ornata]
MPAAETNSTGDLEDASRSNEDKWNEMAKQMGDTRIDNDQSHPNDVDSPATIEDAWPGFWEADQSRDLDDVKPALARLCEQYRGRSWADLDSKLRAENCNTYLVATEDQVSFGYTLVNLRGEPNQRYRVIPSFIKPGTVKKGRMAIGMAASYEENQSRLDDAGVVRPSGVPRCHNCKKEGHIMSDCPEGRRDIERSEYFGKCYNCGSEDHRTRHCQEPRKVITCRNCGQEGHMSRDCSEPEAPTVCNRCNEEGHFSRDCTQPRTDVTCRRCNQMGHMARECPEPDIEITCNTCNQPGHMARDCAGACNGFGHRASDCTNEPAPGAEERRPSRYDRYGFSDGF